MKRKSLFSRILSLCMVLALAVSVGATSVFAAPITTADQKGTITIQGLEADANVQASLYKIIDVNMDSTSVQPKDPVYTWNSDVKQWVADNYAAYTKDGAVTEAFTQAAAADLTKFYAALAKAIENSTITITAAKEVTLDSVTHSATADNMAMGQYLFIANDTTGTPPHHHAPATATLYPEWDGSQWVLNDTEISLKGNGGTIDKSLVGDDTSVGIGDKVEYTVDATIPIYPDNAEADAKNFKIADIMDAGLTWDGTVSITAGAEKDAQPGDQEVADTYYTVATSTTVGTHGTSTFEITFKYDDLKAAFPDAEYVHVTYSGTVNKDGFTNNPLDNQAFLGVNTNPYDPASFGWTPTDIVTVYTYGITVTKVGEENAALSGAEFKLYSDKDCQNEIAFVGSNGVYTKATTDQTGSKATALVTTTDGTLQLKGLGDGTYYLKETKAPADYSLPNNPVTTITVGKGTGEKGVFATGDCTVTSSTLVADSQQVSGYILNFSLSNSKLGDFQLPVTGGMGTVLFTAGGLVLMAGGALLIVLMIKRRKAEAK